MGKRIAQPTVMNGPTRYPSLDGLRGVAALMVLFSHALITSPVFADAISGVAPAQSSQAWWVTYSPMHILWGGTEAVFVFFVLSGFVLTGPALRTTSWAGYYAQRIPRLYLPVWGSLLVAAAVVTLVPRSPIEGTSWWVNAHVSLNMPEALTDALLLGPIGALNGPLWSLQWEVWFSLLLPAYVLIAVRSSRSWWGTVLFVAVLTAPVALFSFARPSNALDYMTVFGFGVLLFIHRGRIAQAARRLPGFVWPVLFLVVVLLITSRWVAAGVPGVTNTAVSGTRVLQVAGAVLLVIVAIHWGAARWFLETPAVQWLGSRSFSLYLIHDPIVSTTAILLGGRANPAIVLTIALPVSLALAEVFFHAVERPSHKLARRLGKALTPASSPRKLDRELLHPAADEHGMVPRGPAPMTQPR
jgi:peptidoglycan/LPS O-acetylase OafA/YrhL